MVIASHKTCAHTHTPYYITIELNIFYCPQLITYIIYIVHQTYKMHGIRSKMNHGTLQSDRPITITAISSDNNRFICFVQFWLWSEYQMHGIHTIEDFLKLHSLYLLTFQIQAPSLVPFEKLITSPTLDSPSSKYYSAHLFYAFAIEIVSIFETISTHKEVLGREPL